jgi:GNAT superfamily N-acetyltransferase
MLVPLLELMNLALSTWYVHVLAAYPEHRGKGLGAALLALAERLAVPAEGRA